MITLPFHVDSPLAAGVFTAVLSLICGLLWWSYDRDLLVGRALRWFANYRLRAVGPERARYTARILLAILTLTFGAMALFGISVETGLIKNGEPPRTLTPQEFEKYSK